MAGVIPIALYTAEPRSIYFRKGERNKEAVIKNVWLWFNRKYGEVHYYLTQQTRVFSLLPASVRKSRSADRMNCKMWWMMPGTSILAECESAIVYRRKGVKCPCRVGIRGTKWGRQIDRRHNRIAEALEIPGYAPIQNRLNGSALLSQTQQGVVQPVACLRQKSGTLFRKYISPPYSKKNESTSFGIFQRGPSSRNVLLQFKLNF